MSFSKNLTITVRNTTAQLNEPLCVYEKDRNLMIYFKIMDYKYKFDKNPTNVLASVDDIMEAYATIVDPNGYELTRRYGEVVDDEIKFVITEDLIDEIEEIGTYKLQFHIICQHSEFTIPEISFEVLERLKGIRTVTDEGVVGDTILNNAESFIDAEGKLNLVWQRGDTISSVRLNQMVEVINNAVDEEHQRQINEVERENRANAKLNELETRFSALTTSQQQSAEVIDARDGEASLKARLDRDIEKAKQIYVDVEGSHISTDSAAGYLKDVEILGNTLVNLLQSRMLDLFCVNVNKSVFKAGKYTVININSKKIGIEVKSISSDEWKDGYTIKPNGVSTLVELLDDAYIATIYGRSDNGWDSTNANELSKTIILEGDHTQNPPSYFEGIASVGDKVEGQELYEIPVLSVKGDGNLFDKYNVNKLSKVYFNEDNTISVIQQDTYESLYWIRIEPSTTYTIQKMPSYRGRCGFSKNKPALGVEVRSVAPRVGTFPMTVTSMSDENYLLISGYCDNNYDKNITEELLLSTIQINKGATLKPYEPYQEDKLTILSPVQLEKVGDVADRIICKDGVWGVEKNNDEIRLDGQIFDTDGEVYVGEEYIKFPVPYSIFSLGSSLIEGGDCITTFGSRLNSSEWNNGSKEGIYIGKLAFGIVVKIETIGGNTKTHMKNYFSNKNHKFKRSVANPTFIPLPHDQQVKLRTFANKTNIQFLTTIEGTIKAQVPKSLGSTVNIQNEQISNLNKELDRVKKLEESTVSTVETESDFTTVEATSSGYFEDVKLEGKTLVNLAPFKDRTNSSDFIEWIYDISNTTQLQNGKEYTFVFDLEVVQSADDLNCVLMEFQSSDGQTLCSIHDGSIKFNGLNSKRFIAKMTIPQNAYKLAVLWKRRGSATSMSIKNLTILEGDHTQNLPSYFEGLKSVGQNVDEVSVNSVKGNSNLVDAKILTENVGDSFIILNYNTNTIKPKGTSWPFIHIPAYKKGKKYRLKMNISIPSKDSGLAFNLATTKSNYPNDKYGNIYSNSNCPESINMIIDGNGTGYWLRGNASNIYSNISLTFENVDIQEFSTLKQDKKRLLYYNNETQAWEKPVLRQWDSIEKHADGKYYYHQRSAEVVLNGTENWSLINTNEQQTLQFRSTNVKGLSLICDKFKVMNYVLGDETEYSFIRESDLNIKILKSKLSSQDATGFKQWLQANNVTVVYQLAQEKVYECTNIDLITYANETNYIVNSGAITPKSTLKVHNNISNVVNLLQKKVSILESNFITMFKAVLSGDYQTLAYSLYPEDFNSQEDNNIQNNNQEDTNNQ